MRRIASLGVVLLATTIAFGVQAEWVKFESIEGNFSVLMPVKPTESKETKPSPVGPYVSTLYLAQADETYLAGWVDYVPTFNFNVQGELEANRDNFVKGVKGTLLSSKSITFKSFPALEFEGRTDKYSFKARVYIVGRRPYLILAAYVPSEASSQNIERFFSSFDVRLKN